VISSRADRDWLRVAAAGAAVSALLVLLSVGTHFVAYRLQVADPGSAPIAALRWFDVNSERNVPTAWSACLLLGSSVLAAVVALRSPDSVDRAWLLVAAVTAFLALDESLELHERLGAAGAAVSGNALHFAWVVPGALLATAVGAVLLGGLRRQPWQVRRRLVVAGAVYLTGALVLETVSGLVLRSRLPAEAYVVVTAAEELLEMTGACLLLATLVVAWRRREAPVEVPARVSRPSR
jgi:hypothetical protein